jgi:hypothetical protein
MGGEEFRENRKSGAAPELGTQAAGWAVWEKMMRGLSTRDYLPVVKDFAGAYGVEKSAVSDRFIEPSKES